MAFDLPTPTHPLKIGTRGSPLALAQAHETRNRLATAFDLPFEAFDIQIITTSGDRILDKPLKTVGGKGLFTKEIEDALLSGDIDIAVHSMKDMPTMQHPGLLLDCFLPREDPRDGFVSLTHTTLSDMPPEVCIGTSSLRRRAQILARRPDLRVVEFRGNVQTRLRKLSDGVAQATFLAMAGLRRLGMAHIAQGAIGLERRSQDHRAAMMCEAVQHSPTAQRLAAERAFLAGLDGSCETPIAGLAELSGGTLRLRGEILRPNGSEVLSDDQTVSVEDGATLGAVMAHDLRTKAGPRFFDWITA